MHCSFCACSINISPCPDRSWNVKETSSAIVASVLPRCKFVRTVVDGLYGKKALFRSLFPVKSQIFLS